MLSQLLESNEVDGLGEVKGTPVASGSGRLLTVREGAERLGVCRTTVYRMGERAELPLIRISNAVRIEAEALDKFIREPSW